MLVEAIELFDCPTHKLAPGKRGDVDARFAEPGIAAGLLKEVDSLTASKQETRKRGRPKKDAPAQTVAAPVVEAKVDGI